MLLGSVSRLASDKVLKSTSFTAFEKQSSSGVINYEDQLTLLKNHEIKCDENFALQNFKIEILSDNTAFRYNYTCVKALLINCSKSLLTQETDCGYNYIAIQRIFYLKNQIIAAGINQVITNVKLLTILESNVQNPCKIKYQYDICELVQCDKSCE